MTTVAASTALVTTTPVWTALTACVSGVRLQAGTWAGLVILLEVPGALLFALVLLQQVPPPLALPGVALVVVGVGLVVRASRPAALAEPGT
jgi:drug/metabolite transporter (DMT)-like permease